MAEDLRYFVEVTCGRCGVARTYEGEERGYIPVELVSKDFAHVYPPQATRWVAPLAYPRLTRVNVCLQCLTDPERSEVERRLAAYEDADIPF